MLHPVKFKVNMKNLLVVLLTGANPSCSDYWYAFLHMYAMLHTLNRIKMKNYNIKQESGIFTLHAGGILYEATG